MLEDEASKLGFFHPFPELIFSTITGNQAAVFSGHE